MSPKSQKLRNDAKKRHAAKVALLASCAEGDGRAMTAEETATIAQIDADVASMMKTADAIDAADAESATFSANAVASVTALSIGLKERAQDNPTRGWDGQAGFGQFAIEVRNFNTQQGMSEGIKILAAAGDGMSSGVKTDGGVLIPPAFSTRILDLVGQDANNLMSECDVLPPLPEGVESMEYPAINETSRADGSRKGGIQGRWKAELTTMVESKPTLKDIKFSPQELYVFVYASDKLLRHAPQLSSFLSSTAADEINFKIGDSIINGTGVGMPRGILTGATDAPRVQIAKETGQPAATFVVANIEKMYPRLPARFMNGAKWYINQNVYPQLLGMTKAVGTGGSAVYMPGNNVAGAPFGTLYGLPVVPIEYCATLGTEGDVILANMKQYAIQPRGGVNSAMSIHLKFDINQTAFRFIIEIDGQPWQISSITPYKGTEKQSPFITLAARA